jgi:hypothetical protein
MNPVSPFKVGNLLTKSDSTVIPLTDALYIGATGDVAVMFENAATVTFVGVPTGTVLNVKVKKLLSTGTGATSVVALYA